MRMIVGITGKLGSGKDYIANNVVIPMIKSRYRYLQWCFADQLKVNVMTKRYIDYKSIYEQKTSETRILLQNEGTENGRGQNEHIWVNYFHNWTTVHNRRGVDLFIVSDVRFRNELDYIKSQGGIIIKVLAPKRNLDRLNTESANCAYTRNFIASHKSECDLDMTPEGEYDMVIDNDSQELNINDLRGRFIDILHKKYNIDCVKLESRKLDLSNYVN